ncbi:unnamed protein product [Rhizophagus irregularis]|nr:unnamed protein product [Rhizophagus irregularis]
MHAVCLLGCLDYEHQFNHFANQRQLCDSVRKEKQLEYTLHCTLSKILGCVNKSTGVRFVLYWTKKHLQNQMLNNNLVYTTNENA